MTLHFSASRSSRCPKRPEEPHETLAVWRLRSDAPFHPCRGFQRESPSFRFIEPPPTYSHTRPLGVSDGASVVVGHSSRDPGPSGAFTWTPSAGTIPDPASGFQPTLRLDNVCILLQNFDMTPARSGSTPCNCFAVQDQLTSNPFPWPYGEPLPPIRDGDPDSRNRARNPWMTQGITDCADWMQAFLVQYDAWWAAHQDSTHPKPIPARFHFDSEFVLTNLGSNNWTHHVWYVAKDA